MSEFKHPLTTMREKRNYTIAGLARKTGLGRGTITLIEKGTSEYKTNIGVAYLLSDALECEISEIFASGELSHKGRPPLTGCSVRVTTVVEYFGEVCPIHFIVLPNGVSCDDCS